MLIISYIAFFFEHYVKITLLNGFERCKKKTLEFNVINCLMDSMFYLYFKMSFNEMLIKLPKSDSLLNTKFILEKSRLLFQNTGWRTSVTGSHLTLKIYNFSYDYRYHISSWVQLTCRKARVYTSRTILFRLKKNRYFKLIDLFIPNVLVSVLLRSKTNKTYIYVCIYNYLYIYIINMSSIHVHMFIHIQLM